MFEVGLVVLNVKVDMINTATNLVVVDVGDVVDGKSVTKGRLLGDLGEPGHKSQLGDGRHEGKGKGQEKGSNRDWIYNLALSSFFGMLCFCAFSCNTGHSSVCILYYDFFLELNFRQ